MRVWYEQGTALELHSNVAFAWSHIGLFPNNSPTQYIEPDLERLIWRGRGTTNFPQDIDTALIVD
jgi:hypothetical protein